MRHWWVNQNQTYRHEVPGGYLWSPKRKTNGGANPFYDFMREVAPGDIVFSFADTLVKAIGVARSHGYEAPKPIEFGSTGAYWDRVGWRVDVTFVELRSPIRPSAHMASLAPLLPGKYSPLRANGDGLQSVYLTRLPTELAGALIDLIGAEAHVLVKGLSLKEPDSHQPAIGLVQWEEHELETVRKDPDIAETERQAIVLARRGQGLFKARVMSIETRCRVTGVAKPEHLRASHCKPWRIASNEERLDGENGLLLTPTIDHLFDRGFIGFEDDGTLLVSPVAHADSMRRMGIDPDIPLNVGRFTSGQKAFLAYHREYELLRSRYLESV